MAISQDDIYLDYFKSSLKVFEKLLKDNDFLNKLKSGAIAISEAIKNGNKLLIAGNGGSAADAQHISTEFMVRLEKDDKREPLPVIALTNNSSLMTAIGNDLGFENIFSRQIQGIGNNGDIFMGISTSGNSKNILLALESARSKGMKTILLTGNNNTNRDWDIILSIPSDETNIIQIAHSLVEHILVKMTLNLTFL
ncbi:SIS domain-containing protein [bacterium]|nr:SIS domain-containing protein [bacterium]